VGIRESRNCGDQDVVCDYAVRLTNYLLIKGRYSDLLNLTLAARTATAELGSDAIARGDHNLGFAYASLPTGDRGDNLRRAIACYEAALRVLAESEFPQDWAMAQNNLGNACASLPAGDHGDNLRRAIACYKAALRVRTESGSPLDWAETQNNLGTAYVDLPTGDRHKNLERAIDCFEAALRVRTERDFPQYWRRPKSISASPMRICLLATATKI